jgi:hypothetical protein
MKKYLGKFILLAVILMCVALGALSPDKAGTNYTILDLCALVLFFEFVRPIFAE